MIATNRQADGAAALVRVLVAGALGALAFADRAFAAPHDTTLVSRASSGAKANLPSDNAAVSGDGRYVAFWSRATNLSPDDADFEYDLYRRDRAKDTTVLVSRVSGERGAKAVGGAGLHDRPAVSADGRVIAFTSDATNLSKLDSDPLEDVYVRDLDTHETSLVSRASGKAGVKAAGWSRDAAISADGRAVAFTAKARNLAPGASGTSMQVFVRDVVAGTTALVSRTTGANGAKGNRRAYAAAISGDGRRIAFTSDSTNLAAGDTVRDPDVYVRDLDATTTALISRASGAAGVKGDGASSAAAISGDGGVVAFTTSATNLSSDDTDELDDVYAREHPTRRLQFPLAHAAAPAPPKREPYPPARLWYRVSVEFKGLNAFTDRASGLPDTYEGNWKLESRNAVRLSLLCTNVKLDPRPFVLSERIRGRQRRVGGCPRPTAKEPRKNLRETVRFAATAIGEMTRWEHNYPVDFAAGCPGRVEHQELVEHHPLTGEISSPSSAVEGIVVFGHEVQRSTVTVTAPAIQCLLTPQGPAYEKPAIATSSPFINLFFGDEAQRVGDKPVSEQLAVRFPPERFGQDYSYTRRLTQPEGEARPRKEYTYTVRFTACPRQGRDVEGCAAGAAAASRASLPAAGSQDAARATRSAVSRRGYFVDGLVAEVTRSPACGSALRGPPLG